MQGRVRVLFLACALATAACGAADGAGDPSVPDAANDPATPDAFDVPPEPIADDGSGETPDTLAPPDAVPDGSPSPHPGSYAPLAPGSVCTPDGWCWQLPAVPSASFQAAWGISADDFWVVGEHGVALHAAGTTPPWVLHRAADHELRAITGFGADDVWAAGAAGTIVHFDGQAWSPVAFPFDSDLQVLGGTGAADLWTVVHESGVIDEYTSWFADRFVRWDGQAWTAEARAFRDLRVSALDGDGTSGVWAVGTSHEGASCTEPPLATGHLLRRGVDGWTKVASTTNAHFDALWVAGPDQVWVAGAEQVSEPGTFEAVYAAVLWRWDGQALSVALRDGGRTFVGVAGAGSGVLDVVTDEGRFVHDAAGQPRVTEFDATLTRIDALAPLGDGTPVAVGSMGGLYVERAGEWVGLQPPDYLGDLTALAGTSASDVWAVGSLASTWLPSHATALHGVGGTWNPAALPLQAQVNDVAALAPDDVWLVGSAGFDWEGSAVSAHWDGGTWTEHPVPIDVPLTSVWGRAFDEVWATGTERGLAGKGSILRWNGLAWALDASFDADAVWAVAGTADGQLWLAGADPNGATALFYRRTEQGWQRLAVAGSAAGAVFRLDAVGATELVGTGMTCTADNLCRPLVMQYDGSVWHELDAPPSPTATSAYAAWGLAPDDWLVATDAGVFRRRAGQWEPFDPAFPLAVQDLAAFGVDLWALSWGSIVHRTLAPPGR